jgi:soluble lytic murein transglycosylase-like protein
LKSSLLPAAFAAILLAGCTSATLDAGGEPGFSYAGGTAAGLPDTMPIPTNSFARSSIPDDAAMAALESRPEVEADNGERGTRRADLDGLIARYAALYEVPEALVRRVIRRESNYRPEAYSKGNWGLMQIRHATARGMGYEGPARGLLDAETNLKYAVKYLRGAWLVAKGDMDRAVRFYASGYYYDAKRMGLLGETGLGRDRARRRI